MIATSYPVLESCARWFPTSCQQKCGSRRTSAKGLERKLVAELWLYPDNSQHGVDLSGEQETKKAFVFFSKRLQAPA